MINEIDFEKYRKHYEAEEHWRLRKAFLKAHWSKFEEDQIHCLAQVFVNMELLGCKYPQQTMMKVSRLANEVQEIRKHRESRRGSLKRTFVGAKDAVQAKIQKTEAPRKLGTHASCQAQDISRKDQKPGSILKLNKSQQKSALQSLLENVIYFEIPDDVNGSISKTISFMQKQGNFEQRFEKDQQKYFYIFNGQIIGEGDGDSKKTAKKIADENLTETLKSNCYTIRSKLLFYSAENVITKTSNTKNKQADVERDKIQENNLGFKMLKMLGWKGGSLGVKGSEGIIDPVTCEIKIGRGGLGSTGGNIGNFDENYFRNLLRNFQKNQLEYDLVFSSEFSKEERARLHQMANQLNLRTKSYGTEMSRHIVISSKLSPHELKAKLLEKDPYLLEKYDIIPPQETQDSMES